MNTTKAIVGGAALIAVLAIGIAVVQNRRAQEAAAALAAAKRASASLEARLSTTEKRAADAEKDSGELLKAVEVARAQAAARLAQQATAAATASAAIAAASTADSEEQERLARERAYQMELATRRLAEAQLRARINEEVGHLDPAHKFSRLLEVAAQHAAKAEFQTAVRLYNQAMEVKPADVPLSDEARQLQAMIREQSAPVEVTLISDGLTFVSVAGQKAPARFGTTTVKIPPGNYEVVGRRNGFQDVVVPVQVRNGSPAAVNVVCTVPLKP